MSLGVLRRMLLIDSSGEDTQGNTGAEAVIVAQLESIPEGVEMDSPAEVCGAEIEVLPTNSTLRKRKRRASDEGNAGKRQHSLFEVGESSRAGRLRQPEGFSLKGKRSKFVVRPSSGASAARFAREEDVTYNSSEDDALTDEETSQRRLGIVFYSNRGLGPLLLIP